MKADPKTVLVVDDELEIAEAVRSILEDEGFRVLTAADGQEALAVLAEQQPNLILLDMLMPRVSGLELIRRLDEARSHQDATVILMSAVSPPAKQPNSRWKAFLQKPFSIDDLIGAVRRFSPA